MRTHKKQRKTLIPPSHVRVSAACAGGGGRWCCLALSSDDTFSLSVVGMLVLLVLSVMGIVGIVGIVSIVGIMGIVGIIGLVLTRRCHHLHKVGISTRIPLFEQWLRTAGAGALILLFSRSVVMRQAYWAGHVLTLRVLLIPLSSFHSLLFALHSPLSSSLHATSLWLSCWWTTASLLLKKAPTIHPMSRGL